MNPAPSKHAQIRDAAETYYKEFGEYVETYGQEVAVAQLAASISRGLTVPAFEEILAKIRERDITETGNVGIWDGDREIWPNETDYTQARDQQAQHQDADVTAIIIALTGETP